MCTGLILSICLDFFVESRLEGWLSIPNRANIKRYGWKKQVHVVHSGILPRCCHFLWNVRRLRTVSVFLSLSLFFTNICSMWL